jgi:cyclopropane fatty-acyl-phospholipid synthase-like methyltransferase
MAAEFGLEATGIDFSPRAIRLAVQKAQERSLDARFFVADALELESSSEKYDTVLDCGLFHVFDDRDRARFVKCLTATVEPDGRYLMLCFSDQQPGDWGPRRVSRAEIQSSFTDGWRIESIENSPIEITIDPVGACAWLAVITRASI